MKIFAANIVIFKKPRHTMKVNCINISWKTKGVISGALKI